MWFHVVYYRFNDVSEECTASILRVEEQAFQSSSDQIISRGSHIVNFHFPKLRGDSGMHISQVRIAAMLSTGKRKVSNAMTVNGTMLLSSFDLLVSKYLCLCFNRQMNRHIDNYLIIWFWLSNFVS
jgi:hypothetical protein